LDRGRIRMDRGRIRVDRGRIRVDWGRIRVDRVGLVWTRQDTIGQGFEC